VLNGVGPPGLAMYVPTVTEVNVVVVTAAVTPTLGSPIVVVTFGRALPEEQLLKPGTSHSAYARGMSIGINRTIATTRVNNVILRISFGTIDKRNRYQLIRLRVTRNKEILPV